MRSVAVFLLLIVFVPSSAQKKNDPVYVDKQGVLRWTKDKSEAAFFGVNYTVPFAYGYRSHKALGLDLKKAIDADVHHMARLGLDAFRVHVWDVEISDSVGNLLQNEHLDLFDYLLSKLKEKKIKILITPIAFWGNGYPEPDVKTNGFSYVYGKGPSVVKEEAFKAQENYLKQFFLHVNPYTKLSYRNDPDVIAMEINNEPHHSGPKERTTEYVNRMAAAVRSTGWTKPIFYNISESPSYADAVVKAKVDGHSFQWYPTGLVANREVKGNFLPNVDVYHIPFADTIAAFRNRAKMVYEFDAGDVMQSVMYPAMARSYRTAGFQWATQFAYDPLYTAYGNTEYQTHYLNLVYTPAKAISLLIASRIFHRVPRGKSYGTYPADTLFDAFRVSYREQLSEMNSDEEFYYSNSTSTQPKNISKLQHIAGVGNSPVIKYEGGGAYFLDKLSDGVWKLEVMPDAVPVKDPFEKASPKKRVVDVSFQSNQMIVRLPDLKKGFEVRPKAGKNKVLYKDALNANGTEGFPVYPGVYLLVNEGASLDDSGSDVFYAPEPTVSAPVITIQPPAEMTAGKPYTLSTGIWGAETEDRISVELRNSSNQWRTVPMRRGSAFQYDADLPADLLAPGLINYRILIKKANGDSYTFPGGFKGNPYSWDEWRNESWSTFVAAPGSPLQLFNATQDRNKIVLYNTDWRNNKIEYTAADEPEQLVLKTTMTKPVAGQMMGWQFFFGDKVQGRKPELPSFTRLVIRARSVENTTAKLALTDVDAYSYSTMLSLNKNWQEIEIPLSDLQKDSALLLPRPYPGFQKLWFAPSGNKSFTVTDIEKLQLWFRKENADTLPAGVEVEWVRLK